MARTARPAAKRLSASDSLAVIRTLEPVVIRDLDSSGAVSIRALRDTINDLSEVREARLWARGDGAGSVAVACAVGVLCGRSYAASANAVDRASIPF